MDTAERGQLYATFVLHDGGASRVPYARVVLTFGPTMFCWWRFRACFGVNLVAARADPLLAEISFPEPSLIGFQQFISLRTVIASDAYAVILSKHQFNVRFQIGRRVGGRSLA